MSADHSKELSELIQAIRTIPMPRDYSTQLNAIVAALNKPTIPVWLISMMSTALGIATTLVAPWFGDIYQRFKLRRVAYLDLVDKFFFLDTLFNKTMRDDVASRAWFSEEGPTHFTFSQHDYLKTKAELYMGLNEYPKVEVLYGLFRRIDATGISLDTNVHQALSIFSVGIKEGWLQDSYLRRFLGDEYGRLQGRVKAHWDERQELLSVAAGISKPDCPSS